MTAAIGRSMVEEKRREAGPQFSIASAEINGKFEAWVMSQEGQRVFTTERVDTAEEAERLAQDWISEMVDTGLAQRGKPTELPPTPEEAPTPTDEAATPEEATSPHMTIALAVRDLLEAGDSIDNPTLTKIANEAFGGTRGSPR